MIQLELGRNFETTIRELGGAGRAVLAGASAGLRTGVKLAAGNVVKNYLTGQSLKRRTGRLARAVDGWMAGDFEGVVGVRPNSSVAKYAWLLGDESKTITPKRAKFLTIPIGENLTGAGVARFSSPRQVPKGFFIRSKTGNLLFGYKRGKKGKFRALFVLKKSVFVQGSGALYDGVNNSLDNITGEMETEIARRTGAA